MEAEDMLPQITSSGLNPDVITYNSLISGYSSLGSSQKCLELYENMKKLGIKPSLRTYHPLLSGCIREGIVAVEKLFNEMLQINLVPDLLVYNALIHCYAEHGDVQKALVLHSEMVDQGIRPDKMTYNSLIFGHLREGKLSKVKELVNDMKVKGLIPKADTYNILVKGYCNLKDFGGAYIWYREMFENGFIPSFCIYNELTNGLKQEGKLKEAQILCSEISIVGKDAWTNEDQSAVAKM